ncbi:MAG: hypothetical protein M9938_07305 [Solirubrobacterales bacterium]|nr:hypothetical protein [Solirubrobacterales bacterium]
MRKGALKKKQRQLEELLLDRREALGELVLGMYVQGDWDDNLLARGAAEVGEVERELGLLEVPDRRPEPDPATGEYTAEHDLPQTGEFTAEHDLITGEHTAEHVLRPPGDHTDEHLLPSYRTQPEEAGSRPAAAAPAPKPDRTPPPPEPPEKPSPSPQPAPQVKAQPEAPAAPATPAKPPTVAPTPSATAPVAATGAPRKASEKPVAPAEAPSPVATPPTPEVAEPPAVAARTAKAEPVQAPPEAPDPLTRLTERIEADQLRARQAIETARATLKTDSRTELEVITREVATANQGLETALKSAAGLISGAEERALAAETRLTRESAAGREAATAWVRSQASEIEADAALAVELEQGEATPEGAADPGEGDRVLAARVASLEAELVAEKAARDEALVTAETRLKEIEVKAREAEEKVAAAESAAASTAPPAPVPPAGDRSEAEARQAAVTWLRGQIGALRKEMANQDRGDS